MGDEELQPPIEDTVLEHENGNWADFGWDAKDGNIASTQAKGLEQILDKVGSDLQRHEQFLISPPWLDQLLDRVKEVEANAELFRDVQHDIKRLKSHSGLEGDSSSEEEGSDDGAARCGVVAFENEVGEAAYFGLSIQGCGAHITVCTAILRGEP